MFRMNNSRFLSIKNAKYFTVLFIHGNFQICISVPLKQGGIHQVKYGPVLVSKELISNIFGKKTENKVKTCKRDFQK